MNLNAKGMIVNNRFADGGVVGSAAAMDPRRLLLLPKMFLLKTSGVIISGI